MIQKVAYLTQPISAHKHMMCCEGNAVGLRLQEDGVNKQHHA